MSEDFSYGVLARMVGFVWDVLVGRGIFSPLEPEYMVKHEDSQRKVEI